ncbi:unnamed protein product [Lactuca virosa]|uniref:DUF7054 domain-containing protein n=1 Tax=Lactuca virosa TaxID=75947 RepID=A0AAU9MHF5_9ASTR|nr:unnamed protein product [Lactuca virosa]
MVEIFCNRLMISPFPRGGSLLFPLLSPSDLARRAGITVASELINESVIVTPNDTLIPPCFLFYLIRFNLLNCFTGRGGESRLLISITVIGSARPIRFVVNGEGLVASFMDTAFKSYALEGCLPILGSNIHDFALYCPIVGTEALSPLKTIRSFGVRNFMNARSLRR